MYGNLPEDRSVELCRDCDDAIHFDDHDLGLPDGSVQERLDLMAELLELDLRFPYQVLTEATYRSGGFTEYLPAFFGTNPCDGCNDRFHGDRTAYDVVV